MHTSPAERRRTFLDPMVSQAGKGVDCSGCPGHCCTFRANSMQVTELEARDMLDYLISNGRWDTGLKQRLQDCISEYRLDREMPTAGKALRRNYTCPFFSHGPLGCTLPREVKPYGCLAFNPTEAGESQGKSCRTDAAAWVRWEQEHGPLEMAKTPIPIALLNLALTDEYSQVSGMADR